MSMPFGSQSSSSGDSNSSTNEYRWQFEVTPPARVVLTNPRGEIRVVGWDRPTVAIRAVKLLDNPARLRATRVIAEARGNEIVVRTITDQISSLIESGVLQGVAADLVQALADLLSFGTPAPVSYEVQVPHQTDLEINGVSCHVRVEGVGGTERVRTVSGEIRLNDLRGDIDLNSVSGDQDARHLNGRVTANSVSGRIELAGIVADLRAKTVSGGVTYAGSLDPSGNYLFNSVSGSLSLEIPSDSRAYFSAQGISLNVSADLPQIHGQGSRSPGRSQWSAEMNGGGAPVRFQTVSGDLRIRGLSTVRPPSAIPNPAAEPAASASSQSAPSSEAPTGQTQPDQTPGEDAQMKVLTALQRGEIGVDEALGRLAALKKARSEGEDNGTA
jgi:putative adhesin